MPDHPVHLADADRTDGILAVIQPKAALEVNGVLGNLVLYQKHDFLAHQDGTQVQALERGAERAPVGIVQVDVVLPADVFAGPDIVVQVLQLIL